MTHKSEVYRFYIFKINILVELVYLTILAIWIYNYDLLGFEVRDDVFFSQSGQDCPVILCPVIPHPHCMTTPGREYFGGAKSVS